MELALIIIIAFAIVGFSLIRGFGNVVGAGGNLTRSLEAESDKINAEKARNNPTSQIFRTMGGVFFGVILLCPILYKHRVNGAPFMNIDHQVRDYLVGFLVVSELLIFLIIWIVDRKLQK